MANKNQITYVLVTAPGEYFEWPPQGFIYVVIVKNILILESNVEVTNYIHKTSGDNPNLSRSI